MTKFNSKSKILSALKKGGSGTPTPPNDSSIEGGAVLILNPEKLTIKVKAKTADSKPIMVEGCKEATLKSNEETTLTAIGIKETSPNLIVAVPKMTIISSPASTCKA